MLKRKLRIFKVSGHCPAYFSFDYREICSWLTSYFQVIRILPAHFYSISLLELSWWFHSSHVDELRSFSQSCFPLGWKLESDGMKRRKEIIPPQKEKWEIWSWFWKRKYKKPHNLNVTFWQYQNKIILTADFEVFGSVCHLKLLRIFKV